MFRLRALAGDLQVAHLSDRLCFGLLATTALMQVKLLSVGCMRLPRLSVWIPFRLKSGPAGGKVPDGRRLPGVVGSGFEDCLQAADSYED